MPDAEYFVPFYKTCPDCNGSAIIPEAKNIYEFDCANCKGTGTVKVLIDLEEVANMTDMNEEALHNLKCCLREA